MQELLRTLFGHEDMSIHIIGWLVTFAGVLLSMLVKGIHKRIKNVEDAQDETEDKLNRLLGEHAVRHPQWTGQERRQDPRP